MLVLWAAEEEAVVVVVAVVAVVAVAVAVAVEAVVLVVLVVVLVPEPVPVHLLKTTRSWMLRQQLKLWPDSMLEISHFARVSLQI